ncbi:MAG: pilus assembly protein PilM [Kofleriaceae bacterium]|nr:pilus assembly protein PilM [Kofleriaceae bacterium]MCL4225237.1 pilus assembly protein PilM [Myxococcales bacterium]
MSRTYAVDLGAWSVKVAVASPGLRHAAVTEVIERIVPPGDEPHEVRAQRVLAELLRERRLEKDTGFLVVSGGQVFVHVLEFGFKALRRQDLEKVVGGELEGVVPVDLEELVYACEPLPTSAGAAAVEPGAVRGRVAPPTEGMRVLTYSMPLGRAKELLELTADAGAEARGLVPVAVLARLAERAPSLAGSVTAAIVDVGHEHTHVVVTHGGKPVFSRTFGRGGRHVTDAIARNWRLDAIAAEQAKHSDGFIASAGNPAPSEAWERVHGVLVGEVGPWSRELRQTLAACRARTGVAPARVLLVGGGSRLRGLAPFVSEQLGLPASTLAGDDPAALLGPRAAEPAGLDSAALAVAAALDTGGGRPSFDLRQGPLAFKVDMTFVKTKLTQVAIALLVVLVFAGASAYAGLRKLRAADELLTRRVAQESKEHFGASKSVPELLALTTGDVGPGESPLPRMSAYDLLLTINGKLPPRDKVTLDVTDLDIKDNRVSLKASAKTPEEIDLIEAALKEITCIKEITRGSTTSGASGEKNFSFTMRTECM